MGYGAGPPLPPKPHPTHHPPHFNPTPHRLFFPKGAPAKHPTAATINRPILPR